MFDKVLNTPLYLLTPEAYLGICEKSDGTFYQFINLYKL